MDHKTKERVLEAKLKASPELCSENNGWDKHAYYKTLHLSISSVKDNVERIDARTVPVEEFQKYKQTYTLVVIMHIQDEWAAGSKWTPEYFRWCLLPTHMLKDMFKLKLTEGDKQRDKAVTWFNIMYPCTQSPTWPRDCKPKEHPDVAAIADVVDLDKPTGLNSDSSNSGFSSSSDSDSETEIGDGMHRKKRRRVSGSKEHLQSRAKSRSRLVTPNGSNQH